MRWYRERACGKWLCVACAAEPRPSLAVTPCTLCGGTHLIDRIPFLGIPRSAAAEGSDDSTLQVAWMNCRVEGQVDVDEAALLVAAKAVARVGDTDSADDDVVITWDE